MYGDKVKIEVGDINKTEITDDDVKDVEKWDEKEYSTYVDDGYYDDYYCD